MKRGPHGSVRGHGGGRRAGGGLRARAAPPRAGARPGPLQRPLERAVLAVGRLDALSTLLPDTRLFLYAYVRKEAVLSSQIEGTQSSLSDLMLFELEEASGVPVDDVVEVSKRGWRRPPTARSPRPRGS